MYEQCFRLHSRPFTATPFVKHYFAAQSMQQSLANARQAIDRGTGPVVVIGGTGTGKSLLMAMLEEQYRSQFGVVNLACARLDDRLELLQNILFELQLPYSEMSEGELRLSLMDFLKPSDACANGILLLVDEAHMLPVELLDEVRLITNYVKDGQPRVRLVMAGNQRLEDNLTNPKLESFNQRIASRCYLTKMSQQETADYVATHIDRAGGDGRQMFSESALRKIHELSDGCPRFVNQICEQAMILAATRGQSVLDDRVVDDAWRDVQNLPGSDSEESFASEGLASNESWTVIEFGNLSDDENAAPDALANEPTEVEDESGLDSIKVSHESKDEWSENSEFPVTAGTDDAGLSSDLPVESNSALQVGEVLESASEPDPQINSEIADANNVLAERNEELCQPVVEAGEADSTKLTPSAIGAVEDPFAEEFATEEEVFDQYAAQVAAQNQSSLAVTTEDIELINPANESEPIPRMPAAGSVDGDSSDEPIPARDLETEEHTDSEHSMCETEYHQHLTQASSSEIERQAEEILSSISLDTPAVSHETTSDEAPLSLQSDEEPSTPTIEFSKTEVDPSRGEDLEDGILESQRMLQQIIEENNRGAANAFPGSEFSNDDSNMDLCDDVKEANDASLAQSNESGDDKDIIIVSRKDEVDDSSTPDPGSKDPIPFPATAVSTGKAERMDYQQLFEQLRKMSDD